MGVYRSLFVLVESTGSLCVLIDPYSSSSVFMVPSGSLCVLVGPYKFFCVFLGLFAFL